LVDDAIVQAVGSTLPELDAIGRCPVTAPVAGHRHVLALPALGLDPEALVERLRARHSTEARDRPGGELAASRPRGEVGLVFGERQTLQHGLDAHLSLQLAP